MMLRAVAMFAAMIVFLGGHFYSRNPGLCYFLTAIGAGWLGIIYAALERAATDHPDEPR